MKKWANELNRALSKEEVQGPLLKKRKKKHKEMPNSPGHKGYANSNHIKIPPHFC
jgi:hypothetical protein